MMCPMCVVTILVALFCAGAMAAEPTTRYSVQRLDGAILLKTPAGKPMARYVVGKLPPDEPQTSAPVVGYLHPIYTPSGQIITESKGGDHSWLRGAFVAWPEVEGQVKAGFWTCGQAVWKQKGQITNSHAAASADEHGASIQAANAWENGNVTLLQEKTSIRARAMGEVYVIDVRIELHAAGDPVKLLPWAFTGFTIHGRRAPGESVSIHDPNGPCTRPASPWNNARGNWPDADWYDLLLTGKDGKSIGLAVISNAANPKTTWNMNPSLRFMSASVTATEPTIVTPDKPLVLRYRLITHDGAPPAQALRANTKD